MRDPISGTLEENILFGLPKDEALYRKVLFAAALEPDLKELVRDGRKPNHWESLKENQLLERYVSGLRHGFSACCYSGKSAL